MSTVAAAPVISPPASGRLDLAERIAATLAEEVNASHPKMVRDAAAWLLLTPGAKRARPRLLVTLGDLLGTRSPSLIDAGVAIELIHTASLLHDDVVDEGDVRRGRATVNARWGNNAAVLVGDYLLSRALRRMDMASPALLDNTFKVVEEMSRAAVLEVEARSDAHLTPEQWRAIAEGKTAALFGLCGWAAGVIAAKHDQGELLMGLARGLGSAFQMQDDLQDLVDAASSHSDLRQRNPSYPVVLAARADAGFTGRLSAAWASDEVDAATATALAAEVLQSAAVDATLRAIVSEVERARAALSAFGKAPQAQEILVWAATLGQDPRGPTA